jgi:hypothetical protein
MVEIHGSPFQWGNSLFAFTNVAVDGEGAAELEAYRLAEPNKSQGGEPNEKIGWLHGEKVRIEGWEWILQGPPSIFTADPSPLRPKLSPQPASNPRMP